MDPSVKTRHEEEALPAETTGVGNAPPIAEDKKPPPKRTPGLKIFDVFLYPFLTNIGVFVISVFATYLTKKGDMKNEAGELVYGKPGKILHQRGEWLMDKFRRVGMTEEQADMSKMVFFSFADGSLMAPFIKLFEDRRERIAKGIDTMLGTKPEDEAVYEAEPKQTWGSVLGSRLATASIVVPTAVVLDKVGQKDGQWIWNKMKDNPGFESLNERLFTNRGKKIGEWIEKRPEVAKHFGSHDVKELSKISAFEGFYTSVCTAGVYFISRFFARKQAEKQAEQTPAAPPAPVFTASAPVASSDTVPPFVPLREQPEKKIFSPPEGIEAERLSGNELHLA